MTGVQTCALPISTGSELLGLRELSKLDSTQDTQFLKAKAYYNLELFDDAMKILHSMAQTDDVIRLENEIHRKRAYQFVAGYEMYVQKLNDWYEKNKNGTSGSSESGTYDKAYLKDQIAKLIGAGPDRDAIDKYADTMDLAYQEQLAGKLEKLNTFSDDEIGRAHV